MNAGDALLAWLGDGLLWGSLFALATWIITATILRNARPSVHVALWSVVLLKFLVPVGPAAPFSLSGLLSSGLSQTEPVVASVVLAPEVSAAVPTQGLSLGAWMWLALSCAYVLIVLALGLRTIIRSRAAVARARRLPRASAAVRGLVVESALRVGLKKLPRAVLCKDTESPFVVGGRDAVVAVPEWLSADPERLRPVLLHELAHLRRRDQWARQVEGAVGVLFFFWPLVPFVRRRLEAARERACDQWAVHCGDISASQFARVLVAVAQRTQGSSVHVMALARRQSVLEQRVRDLVTNKGARPTLGPVFAGIVALWGGVALAGPNSDSDAAVVNRLCATDPRIGSRIMASNPEADVDGDGVLSKKEVCAHQLRMKTRIVGRAAENRNELSRRIDSDGDGQLSDEELLSYAERVVIEVERDAPSKVVLHLSDSGLSTELAEGVPLQAAEVSGTVCEPTVGRCEVRTSPGQSDAGQSLLFIDVQ